jgi:hypothetical protein
MKQPAGTACKALNFDEEEHRYTDDEGREYLSVTTLLATLFPFDRDAIAERVIASPSSEYFGMAKEDVLEQWERSASLGTEVHIAIENWINSSSHPEQAYLAPLVNQFSRLGFAGELDSEVQVWDEAMLLAGTVDIIEKRPDCWVVWDIKTSKSIQGDTLTKYSMQLEIYRRMTEQLHGIPAQVGGIIWFADYVRQRERAQLKIVHPADVGSLVDDLLVRRREELTAGRPDNPA